MTMKWKIIEEKIYKYKCPICGEIFNDDYEENYIRNLHEIWCLKSREITKNIQPVAIHYGYNLYNEDHYLELSGNLFKYIEDNTNFIIGCHPNGQRHFNLPINIDISHYGTGTCYMIWSKWPHRHEDRLELDSYKNPKSIKYFYKILKAIGAESSKIFKSYL